MRGISIDRERIQTEVRKEKLKKARHTQGGRVKGKKELPAGWIEQPTSSLRVTRSTTELSGLYKNYQF